MRQAESLEVSRFKVLCLHGAGTNSDIFESQTAALRYRLGLEEVQCDFVEGAHLWPAAPGIKETFGYHQNFYSYSDGTAQSVITAVNDLAEYVEDNGPFDAVMGFSLGAGLVATLLLRSGLKQTAIKSAIFLSACSPCDWGALEQGRLRFLTAEDAVNIIGIPTVHSWSHLDTINPGQSEQLLRICDKKTCTEVRHNAGHNVPNQVGEVGALATAIKRMLAGLRSESD
ncbi:Esterase C25G4.2-like protein [Cladobotryum mycophilum]|uniref:Esterase C25G4.2-like protein n=1 Tax=Cladobotryum mycophilum TaxID=491253 RepID=A0ABR0SW29_9HYPO